MTEPDIKYGGTETTYTLDEHGSTITDVRNFHGGNMIETCSKRYKLRVKVHNDREEQEEYAKFSKLISEDDTVIDPTFRIEKSKLTPQKGYYFVVKEYTVLMKL